MIGTAHAAPLHGHSGGVRDERLLEGDLGPVGETGDHRRILTPLFGETLLRRRSPVRIVEPLDVPGHQWPQTDAAHEPQQVHLHPGLVAVAAGVDDTGGSGLLVEGPTDRPVDFCIQQHEMLSAGDRRFGDSAAVLDGAGGVDDHVDVLRRTDGVEIVGDDRPPALERFAEFASVGGDRIVDAGLRVRGEPLVDGAVDDRRDRHARNGVDDLVDESGAHESGPDEADPDRGARFLERLESIVDDDHDDAPPLVASSPRAARSPSSGHCRSLSLIMLGALGQEISSTGSSYLSPRSVFGV